MDQGELRRLWAQNKDRPAWVRERRDVINDAVDVSQPVPQGSLHDVRDWLQRFKSTVTRQLKDDADDEGGEN